jgi:F-type H+-transporting ATPase subunit epsilon
MRIKVLIPTEIVVDELVNKVIAEGEHGVFCLLPRHVDFLAALVPGLLSFEDADGKEQFVAVDQGILIKQRDQVVVSAGQAVRGGTLEQLRDTVREEFLTLDDRERAAHSAVAKLEASFLRSYLQMIESKS